ncbi:uncharacterized protein PgNI_09875, partial [Pyricularia grisea]|uniref:Uncharacterized protein n=1 Tax=Pyricularia grisea TaxID=148305 RepID=A0A6P8AS21_PYRGI
KECSRLREAVAGTVLLAIWSRTRQTVARLPSRRLFETGGGGVSRHIPP